MVAFCCFHFDEFIGALYDLKDEVRHMKHADFVKFYADRGGIARGTCPTCGGIERR